MNYSISCLILLTIFFGHYGFNHCLHMLKLIPGVPSLTYVDPDHAEEVVFKTRRYGRKSDYVVNLEFTNKQTWANNNVSVHIIFYEYLHNEYRLSFVEMHFKICDLILRDPYVGLIIRTAGLKTCPLPPGKNCLSNMTFNHEFPSMFPFEKGKAELILKLEPSHKIFAKGDLIITFKSTNI